MFDTERLSEGNAVELPSNAASESASAADTAALRIVLLDVDGTLLASNNAHAAAWSDACAEFGYERDEAFFRPLIGMGGDRVLPLVDANLNDSSGTGKKIAERRKAIYTTTYFPQVVATRGARALVQRFCDEGWTCTIASSATSDELAAALERIGIADLIDGAAKSDDADSSKPAPNIVQAALRKAAGSTTEAFLLADTPYDIEAATGAGIRCVALLTGGWDAAALDGAVAVYDDPQALLDGFDWAGRRL